MVESSEDLRLRLSRLEKDYRTLFDYAGDALFLHDLSGKFLNVNRIACHQLGYDLDDLLQSSMRQIEAQEYHHQLPVIYQKIAEQGEASYETEHVTSKGKRIPMWVKSRLIDYRGEPAVLSTARDITERKQLEAGLHRMALTDFLTGLMNRRAFFDKAALEISRAYRYRVPFGLLILDVDYFKSINDRLGHQMGDVVLCEVANCIQETIRDIDMAFRVGGEEFAILLPCAQAQQAYAAAERIRLAMRHRGIPTAQGEVFCTVSIGSTSIRNDESSIESIMARADEAMYKAKDAGRNQVVLLE